MHKETQNAMVPGVTSLENWRGRKISVREIADRLRRGKSYVDSLIVTSKCFAEERRHHGYTWFSHDLLRRAVTKVQ